MIQELLGGSSLIAGERKISINGTGILEKATLPSLSPSPSSSSSSTSSPSSTATTSSANNPESLRCPRCDSSNTKFCYYNNYNLTQPRHFCKTCRRYWTKGGALRNVPIGGGCRKNKNVAVSVAASMSASKTSGLGGGGGAGKMKMVGSEIGRSVYDHHEFPPSPILWGSPQSSHLLTLLRSAHQNPNPNIAVKEESGAINGSHMMMMTAANTTDQAGFINGSKSYSLGLDPVLGGGGGGQVPSLGLCSSSFWRSDQNQQQPPPPTQQQNGFLLGEVHGSNNGIQQLYQRLRSSSDHYYGDHSALVLTNVASSSSSSASMTTATSISESAPVGGGELGYWNPPFSWSDLPTTNGAYP